MKILNKQEVVEKYKPGVSLQQIAKEYGVSRQYISVILKSLGVKTRKTRETFEARLPQELKTKVLDLYQKGKTLKQLELLLNVSSRSIKKILKESNITLVNGKTRSHYSTLNEVKLQLFDDYKKLGLLKLQEKYKVSWPSIKKFLQLEGIYDTTTRPVGRPKLNKNF